jgi:ketopantoate reductase
METEISDNIIGVLWSKLTYTCLGYYGSLADASLATSCADDLSRRTLADFLGEVVAVGHAMDTQWIRLTEYNPPDFLPSKPLEQRLQALNDFARSWQPNDRKGPLRQIQKGIKTETDFTLGYVVDAGAKYGIKTPLCRQVLGMIRELETGTRPLTMANYAELNATPR